MILFLLLIPSLVFARLAGPLYVHEEREQKEFEHLYQDVNNGPIVTAIAGVPTTVPRKVGDIYVNTSTGKVYIATATVTSASWAILN